MDTGVGAAANAFARGAVLGDTPPASPSRVPASVDDVDNVGSPPTIPSSVMTTAEIVEVASRERNAASPTVGGALLLRPRRRRGPQTTQRLPPPLPPLWVA